MKKTQYRDREGALHFNLTINEVELTAICSCLRQFIIDNQSSKNPIIAQRIEVSNDLLKTLES